MSNGGLLRVMEQFHSIQGEGVHMGRSAVFLRLAGCNVGCPWCDTKTSWSAHGHPLVPVERLVDTVRQAQPALVVITGGEPLQQDLTSLCQALVPLAIPRHLETSGVAPLSGAFEWITLSPKRHRPPRPALLERCHELKVVIHEPADLDFAMAMAAACRTMGRSGSPPPQLCVQPGAGSATGARLAIHHVKQRPQWRLSLQTHKWLGVR
ncbi:MAG: 7-carboxy-7-deazaguanine synthase [Candidatus Synechococcus spongiarum SP3]|uniref:7-carboxy-7-deazaguanine synthase n=1 Tax=Candidatus Synechococcus spongiarum SP3 TaxID=1604020 RepID=A0A0G2J4A9_9SYNE|nr:MAG: 7-carboxy-7-deazaguanine synthase [Candidatus Synechococcus spongiarum SP3]